MKFFIILILTVKMCLDNTSQWAELLYARSIFYVFVSATWIQTHEQQNNGFEQTGALTPSGFFPLIPVKTFK